jgi:uncharacterized UBP type Zn finger protein
MSSEREWDKHIFPTYINDTDQGVTKTIYEDAPMMIVELQRNTGEEKVTKCFVPPRTLRLSKRVLHLSSIIIHIGRSTTNGHYVALLKATKDKFVYYDDMTSTLKRVDAQDVFSYKKKLAAKNAVAFVYQERQNV